MEKIPTAAEVLAAGKPIEVLFWVGCAGSFDERAKKISRAFAMILQKCKIEFAILGNEEKCTGDPAKRAGNEFLFQMQAFQNIQLLQQYAPKTIVTACPHCFNTLKNEYPLLGGDFEVLHHTVFLDRLLKSGQLKVKEAADKEKVTYHDACYLARGNDIVEIPRDLLQTLQVELKEMKNAKKKGLCCGAGGAQIFKESEPSTTQIHHMRAAEALETGAKTIVTACPFCNLMLKDGLKFHEKEKDVQVLDLVEMLQQRQL